jgi:hypothetical protein
MHFFFLSTGALMNTRGLVELIVLNLGREGGVIDSRLFTIMVRPTPCFYSLTHPDRRVTSSF